MDAELPTHSQALETDQRCLMKSDQTNQRWSPAESTFSTRNLDSCRPLAKALLKVLDKAPEAALSALVNGNTNTYSLLPGSKFPVP